MKKIIFIAILFFSIPCFAETIEDRVAHIEQFNKEAEVKAVSKYWETISRIQRLEERIKQLEAK